MNLNTSYVDIKLKSYLLQSFQIHYLNTSYVDIKQIRYNFDSNSFFI